MLDQNKNEPIFNLLQAALFEKEITLPEDVDWNQILQEMKKQTIAGLPYEWLYNKNILDDKIKTQWNQTVVFQMVFWVKIMQEQESLIQLMNANDIDMVILKGAAAAIYYPKPDLRVMGDIDFFVHPQNFQKAYHILLKNGYQLVYPEDHAPHHIVLKKNNIIFEIHKSLSIIARNNAGKHQKYLQNLIETGLCSIEQRKIEKWTFPMFPRLQNGMVLLLHVVQHLKGGLGLRQIADWMMFVDKELNDEVWKSEFQPVLQNIKLEKFAIILTKMCQLHLGLKTENITWCFSADPSLCNELLDYFMEKGNFGRKTTGNGKVVSILSTDKNLIQFLKRLQHNGKINWKLAKKYSILQPFAWFYQICKYIQCSFNNTHPILLVKDWKKHKRFLQLFDDLKLFEKSEKD